MSVENLGGPSHVGVLHAKAFVPVARGDNEAIVGCDHETLMTLLNTFVEMIAQMTTVQIDVRD